MSCCFDGENGNGAWETGNEALASSSRSWLSRACAELRLARRAFGARGVAFPVPHSPFPAPR